MKRLIALALCAAGALPAADAPKLTDFDWLSGRWCGGASPERVEEVWLAASGGMLMGMSRTTRGERTVSFEFMRIVAGDPVPSFIAQPNGGAPVSFKWSGGGASWARFENPAHDFPKRVEYRREGDKLHAEIAGPGKDGRSRSSRSNTSAAAKAPAPAATPSRCSRRYRVALPASARL